MTRFWNSFQVQLYGVLLLLTALLVGSLYINSQSLAQLEQLEDVEEELTGSQLSNVYLLASLARRYANAADPDTQTAVGNLLRATISNAQEIQDNLLEGNAEEGLPAITDAALQLQPLIEDANREWSSYIALLEGLLEQVQDTSETSENILNQDEVLTQIDRQSVTVYTYTDRIVEGLDFGLDQQRNFANQTTYFIGFVTLVSLGLAIFVVSRSVRAVASLSNTAQEFAKGRFSTKADTETFTEIAEVGTVFNDMAQRLGSIIRELENQALEAQNARLKAERSDEVKSAFLASMSHELRTPLNSIINFSKFVVRGMMGPVTERQEETLNKVVASGQHLLSLINDVLDMSKIESGSLSLFVEDNVDLKAIVDSVVTNSQSLLADKAVSLETQLPEEIPFLRGDKKRITQILLNLVSNACKFTDEGSVLISMAVDKQELIITVKDTGAGIAEDDRLAVFEAFKQTRSGLRSGEGTGLGMPISKSLVEAHQGRLWFDSTVGQGTSFYVSLPIKSEQLVPIKP
jgi:signal transduction histidine kinase